MANTFNLGNGNWAQKTEKLLAYNAENDNYKPLPFDFDRGSTATRVNKQGLIETVGIDEPRIDFLNNTKGHLLLEPKRRNHIPYSEDFSVANWVAASGASKEYNVAISPDGTQNAARFSFDGTFNGRVEYSSVGGLTNGTTYTISVYLKSESGNIENVKIGHSGWGIKVVTVTNEWQRFTQTITSNSTTAYPRVRLDTEGSVLVWGYQLEDNGEGSDATYATSYIPTQGSAVTRSAESCSGAGNSTVFNDSEGVLYAEFYAEANNTEKWITLSDGTSTNRVIVYISTANILRIYVQNSSGGQADFFSSITLSQYNKVAFSYKENDFKLFLNGTKVGSDTSGGVPSGLDRLNLADSNGTTNPFIGKVKDVRVYNTALTDAQLIALTTI